MAAVQHVLGVEEPDAVEERAAQVVQLLEEAEPVVAHAHELHEDRQLRDPAEALLDGRLAVLRFAVGGEDRERRVRRLHLHLQRLTSPTEVDAAEPDRLDDPVEGGQVAGAAHRVLPPRVGDEALAGGRRDVAEVDGVVVEVGERHLAVVVEREARREAEVADLLHQPTAVVAVAAHLVRAADVERGEHRRGVGVGVEALRRADLLDHVDRRDELRRLVLQLGHVDAHVLLPPGALSG